MLIIITIITSLLQAFTALFVLFRNRRSLTNIFFSLLSFALLTWSIINFAAATTTQTTHTIILIRLVIFSVVIANTLFFLFAHAFAGRALIAKIKYLHAYLLLTILTLAVSLTPLVFTHAVVQNSQANPVPGPGIVLFMLHALISVIGGFRTLIRKWKDASRPERRQLMSIIVASAVIWTVVPITNFGLTLLLHTTIFPKITPIYVFLFSTLIAYSIISQRLFDIRAAVARSVAYLLIIITMTGVYGVSLFGIIDVIFRGQNNETLRQVLSTILVTPLALSFQPIKHFFDRRTNRIFYRDAYDSQEVLDKLGYVAVSEMELQRILHQTRVILDTALRSSFVEFILYKKDKPYLIAHEKAASDKNMLTLSANISEQRRELLVIDELPHSVLRTLFDNAGVALSLKLRTQDQVVGYIVIGGKKSGDIYSTQDRELLGIAANELAISVQNALRFEEIRNFNLTLQARIDDATQRLRTTNQKLKALDETKDDFISMASHQLRTPLTSVKGYVSMVLDGDAGHISPLQRKLLNQAFLSSQRMVFLISDLLNVSRLKTGKFVIEEAPCNLAEVVEEEVVQLKETAEARGLELSYTKPPHFPTYMVDETKLRQVIMNFMDNAIYYTPTGGHIDVALTEKPNVIELTVTDNGMGVPKSDQHHLFGKFFRAHNATRARPDGTGLGLFMAKKVIIAQGGAILFHSKEGQGSTFGFTFAKSKLTPVDAQK